MLRIRSDFLTLEDNYYFLEGSLFSGLSYDVDDEGLVQGINIIEEGAMTGSSGDILTLPEGGLRVDEEYLEVLEDYGPECYQGEIFKGVVYSFTSEGYCEAEAIYETGFPSIKHTRTWYPSGQQQTIQVDGVTTMWFEDGWVAAKSTLQGFLYNLRFTDNGELISIILRESEYIDFSTIRKFSLGEELTLIGQAIDAAFLRELDNLLSLAKLKYLRLKETNVNVSFEAILPLLENLSKLELDDNEAISSADALRLKQQRPDCTILFNDERIELDDEPPASQA